MARVLGIDGARGGWVIAELSPSLHLSVVASIDDVFKQSYSYDCVLMDMIMGLPSSPTMLRPETDIHRLLGRHSASLFRVPCREAAYAETKAEMYRLHEQVMHQKLTPFIINLIPKIKEVDRWLLQHKEMQSVLFESHPETAFQLLAGKRLVYSKHKSEGVIERFNLLTQWVPGLSLDNLINFSKTHRIQVDDVLDAIVLAYTAMLHLEGRTQQIPTHPQQDDQGLWMRAILPL